MKIENMPAVRYFLKGLLTLFLYIPLTTVIFYLIKNIRLIPSIRLVPWIIGDILLITIFIVAAKFLWKMTNLVINKNTRIITKSVIILILSVLYFFMTAPFILIEGLILTDSHFTKTKFGDSPKTYYIQKTKPWFGGDMIFTLYEKDELFSMKEIGSSGSMDTDISYSDPEPIDFIVKFSEPDDNMFKTVVFYYRPAMGELIAPENYNPKQSLYSAPQLNTNKAQTKIINKATLQKN